MTDWIDVKDQLPPNNTPVLVTVETPSGYHLTIIAAHVAGHTITNEEYGFQDWECDMEYDEENDCYWISECWYEENFVEDNANWIIDPEADGVITHWMKLPEPAGNREDEKP